MTAYASKTTVSVARSRIELEELLAQHGATAFGSFTDGARQVVAFQIAERNVRMTLPMPDLEEHKRTPQGRSRSRPAARQAYEQEQRRRWRSLVAVVKAKLVAIDDGISTVEREFLVDMVTDNGLTVGEIVQPHLALGQPLRFELER